MGGISSTNSNSPVATALAELVAVLQDPSQSDGVVKVKMQAYRNALQSARATLKTSQDDLTTLVTLRQEGVLVTQGYLE